MFYRRDYQLVYIDSHNYVLLEVNLSRTIANYGKFSYQIPFNIK